MQKGGFSASGKLQNGCIFVLKITHKIGITCFFTKGSLFKSVHVLDLKNEKISNVTNSAIQISITLLNEMGSIINTNFEEQKNLKIKDYELGKLILKASIGNWKKTIWTLNMCIGN